jgi:hypothetical protein
MKSERFADLRKSVERAFGDGVFPLPAYGTAWGSLVFAGNSVHAKGIV